MFQRRFPHIIYAYLVLEGKKEHTSPQRAAIGVHGPLIHAAVLAARKQVQLPAVPHALHTQNLLEVSLQTAQHFAAQYVKYLQRAHRHTLTVNRFCILTRFSFLNLIMTNVSFFFLLLNFLLTFCEVHPLSLCMVCIVCLFFSVFSQHIVATTYYLDGWWRNFVVLVFFAPLLALLQLARRDHLLAIGAEPCRVKLLNVHLLFEYNYMRN